MRNSIFEDPPATPFAECPNCRRLLQIGVSRCPDCYEPIEDDYAGVSGAVVLLNTKGCAMANTIKTMDAVAPLSIGVAAISYVSDLPSGFLISSVTYPLVAIIAIGVWFGRFGWFSLGDEDFAKAKHSMRVRLLWWLGLATALFGFVYLVFFVSMS